MSEFDDWWNETGQFLRAGDRDYEMKFAKRVWAAAQTEERQACMSAGVEMAEQYQSNAELHPHDGNFVKSMNDRACGCLNLAATIRARGDM